MRILFWGTPRFAVPSLRALDDEGFDVAGVVTRPDRPAGRGRKLTPSPVKVVAEEMGVPVLTPDRPRGDAFMAEVDALAPDLSVVVAYGHILRLEVLELPPMGSINVHASLLPELRGAAPINWAIARGYDITGITVMRMVEAMDAGPILHQVAEPILEDETASELQVRLSELGAAALVEALTLLMAGDLEEVEQDHERATYAPKVDRATARIDWSRPAREIAWHVRGMDAVPGAWSELGGVSVKLFRPAVEPAGGEDAPGGGSMETGSEAAPGTILVADPDRGLVVAAGEGRVRFLEVQPPGRKRMDVTAWLNGRGAAAGQRFE
ncbi:MAG: methionyl-tRNA formyltransferase [Gemmatimonadota bacterium]